MPDTKGKIIKCKAAIAHGRGQPLALEDILVHPPKAGEIRVKIVATGLCHSDVSEWEGRLPHSKFPCVLGHEGAGIVESVGDGITSFSEGDHVLTFCIANCKKCPLCQLPESNLCMRTLAPPEKQGLMVDGTARLFFQGKGLHQFMNCGTFSQYTVLEESFVAKVDKKAPLEKICPLSCGFTTGYGSSVRVAKVREGATCIVFGLGSVGLAAALGCKHQGAKRIIGVDINNGKEELAKKFGVTEFYNPNEQERPIEEVLKEKTHGGCDYAFECSGISKVAESAIEACRIAGGLCVLIGVPPIGHNLTINPYQFLFGRTLTGVILGGYRKSELPKLVNDYMEKKITVDDFITSTSSIDDINKAFQNIGKGNSLKHIFTL